MISDLQKYPALKDSGEPWLGDIPAHWASERAKWLFTKMDRPVREHDEVVTCFRDGVVTLRKNRRLRGFTEATVYSGYQGIRQGDLVIHGMDAFAGAIGVSDSDGKGTPVYNVCQPRPGVNARYYAHLVREMSRSQWILALAKGIRERSTDFRFEMFGNQRVSLPPPDEQAAIVRFLDWANGRLERAIRAKRKVIALLNEQKQAIIHRAVTRGLDPSVPLKPSGIPWLGDIPQHWEVWQLRHMGRLHKGVGGSKEDATLEGVPCVRYGELYFHYRNFIRQPRGFVSTDTAAAYTSIRFGDVLFAASGERVEEIGKSAVNLYGGTAVCGGDIVIFRPTVAAHAAFLGYALDSYGSAHQKATMCRGTTIKHIYPDELRGLWFCVPPLSEQEKIAASLDSELLGCDTAISRLEREIELLREYRTRLVADVVTGKLDVREAALLLPDEAPPDTVEDAACLPDRQADLGDEIESEAEEIEA